MLTYACKLLGLYFVLQESLSKDENKTVIERRKKVSHQINKHILGRPFLFWIKVLEKSEE